MIDYMMFWFAQALTHFLLGVGIIILVIIFAVGVSVYSDYMDRKYWKKQTKEWRYGEYNRIMSHPHGKIKKWQKDMYRMDQL